MKKVLCSIIAIAGACLFFACSNGDYLANPTTVSNQSDNPLDYLDSNKMTWTGTDALSAKINGAFFNSDSAHTSWFLDTAGYNYISGLTGISHGFVLRFRNVYAGNLYTFGTLNARYNTERICVYYDSVDKPRAYSSALGNVGEVYIIENDSSHTTKSRIKGKFYFQAIDGTGKIVNVTEGWFNVKKYP
jgi:hypothetical protein